MINTKKVIAKCLGRNNVGGQPILRSHWAVKVKYDTYSSTKGPFDTKQEAESEGQKEVSRGAKSYLVVSFPAGRPNINLNNSYDVQ